MTDPLRPSVSLLSKLGSIIVHTEEAVSPDGHEFDQMALRQLTGDPEVKEWLLAMGELALIPVKRK